MRFLVGGRAELPARWRPLLSRAARRGLGRLARRRGEVCIVVVGGREIRRLNRKFLGHDRVTDVIAFPYGRPGRRSVDLARPPGRARRKTDPAPFGDIVVCLAAARRQARALGHSLLEELLTLAAHGALHLAGHDDHGPVERRIMFARQGRIVRGLLRG